MKAEEAIRQYMPMIRRFAGKYVNATARWADFDDLISFGMIAVAKAAETYDPSRGASFSTHVFNNIRAKLGEERRRASLSRRGLRERHLSVHSTDPDNDGYDLACSSPRPDDLAILSDRAQAIRTALNGLTVKQRQVLLRRFYADETFEEIGDATGRSKQAIQKLESYAIDILRGRTSVLAHGPSTGGK
jgi:RNA polymerase sigma factor (sigma-70 family)